MQSQKHLSRNAITILACSILLVATHTATAVPIAIGGGWEVDAGDSGATVHVDAINQEYILIEISKNFTEGFDGAGFPPIDLVFNQVGDDLSTVPQIVVLDESVTNLTGFNWTDYHYGILDGEDDVWFSTGPNGFDTTPFSNQVFGGYIDGPANTKPTTLDVDGGMVQVNESFFPGSAGSGGELIINVDLAGPDGSFTFRQFPTPEPTALALLGLGALCLGRRRAARILRSKMILVFIVSLTLVLASADQSFAQCGFCPVGTQALVDGEGDNSGWCLSGNRPDDYNFVVIDVDPVGSVMTIKLNKNFMDPPGFFGDITPILFDFTQICPDADTVSMIVLEQELIVNQTSVNWESFEWILFEGPSVWFSRPASANFDVTPYNSAVFSDFLDPGTDNMAKKLTATDGVVPDNSTFTPGALDGDLKIMIDLSGGQLSFTLKELPRAQTCTPVTIECPAPQTVECDGSGNTAELNAWLAGATTTGDCPGINVSTDFNGLSDDCGATGSATVVFTATDDSGAEESCTSTFTIQDTIAPSVECSAISADCCENGKPSILTVRYTGEDCSASSTTQPSDKWECSGDPASAPLVHIIANDNSNPSSGKIWFDGNVALGSTFDIDAANAGETRLGSATFIHIFDGNNNLLQTIEFHTSCSQPLHLGDQFGSALLVGCVGENEVNPAPIVLTVSDCMTGPTTILANNDCIEMDLDIDGDVDLADFSGMQTLLGNEDCIAPMLLQWEASDDACGGTSTTAIVDLDNCGAFPVENGESVLVVCASGDCCEAGTPRIITAIYTGQSFAASSTSQPNDKWSCSGDPGFAPLVRIVANDNSDWTNTSNVWFNGMVALGTTFNIDAANAGEPKLKSATWVHILDFNDNVLQSVEFHTSCSQPLFLGDQFGSVRLQGCVGENDTGDCRPLHATLTVTTDDDCGLSDTCVLDLCAIQALNCYECDGPITSITVTWDGGQAIRVRAYDGDSDDPVIADIDNVAVGQEITISGFSGSPNNVVWEIYEAGTSNLLGTSEFHLSCSDGGMDGPEDCGSAQGNGKDDDAGLINDWIFGGMISDGGTLDCSAGN